MRAFVFILYFCLQALGLQGQKGRYFPVTWSFVEPYFARLSDISRAPYQFSDSIRLLEVSSFDLHVSHTRQYLVNTLPRLSNLKEIIISLPKYDSLGLANLFHNINIDSTLNEINAIFRLMHIEAIHIWNPNGDSADYILNNMFHDVTSIQRVVLDFATIEYSHSHLPSFVQRLPNLKTLSVYSKNYPVIISQEYLSRLPLDMQSSDLTDKLCLLKGLLGSFDIINKYSSKWPVFDLWQNQTEECFAVYVGNFCEHRDSISPALTSLPPIRERALAALYVVNGYAENFFRITDSSILKEIKFLYVFGALPEHKLEFISNLRHTHYFIHATKPGSRPKHYATMPFRVTIVLEYKESTRRERRLGLTGARFEYISRQYLNMGATTVYTFILSGFY